MKGVVNVADYISREALTEAFENADADVCESYPDGYCDWGFGRENIREVIAGVPAADVEPVRHGRWEGYSHSRYCGIDADGEPVYRDGVVYYCSNPKCRRKTVIKENYCPNCGAKMDLEDDNGT